MSRIVLVTGGAGYIGSHVCKALKLGGFTPVTFDNLSHGHEWAVRYGPFFYGDLHKLFRACFSLQNSNSPRPC